LFLSGFEKGFETAQLQQPTPTSYLSFRPWPKIFGATALLVTKVYKTATGDFVCKEHNLPDQT
jgi:hypothetical protein